MTAARSAGALAVCKAVIGPQLLVLRTSHAFFGRDLRLNHHLYLSFTFYLSIIQEGFFLMPKYDPVMSPCKKSYLCGFSPCKKAQNCGIERLNTANKFCLGRLYGFSSGGVDNRNHTMITTYELPT